MSYLIEALASPRKFITSTLSKANTSRKPTEANALCQLPQPPLKKFDASSLPQCVKTFFHDGKVPTKPDAQAEIARFCLKNEQPLAMAWLFLRLEDIAPGKPQSLQLTHTSQVSRDQRLKTKDAVALAKWLGTWLGSLPLLTSVDVSKNLIGDKGVKAFAKLLSKNPPLQHLSINSAACSGRSITKLAKALLLNTTLLSLDVSSNACENGVVFGDLLACNTTLQSLDLSNMRDLIDHEGRMRPVAEGLAKNMTLRHFGGACLPMPMQMIEAIESNTTLTSINLNAMMAPGFFTSPALLTALCNHPLLKRIQLYRCLLDGAGVDALQALVRKPGLEAIDVSYCDLSWATVKSILDVLLVSPSMLEVDLSGNQLTGRGEDIAAILTHNEKLTSLKLADTKLSRDDLRAIRLAVNENENLLELDLSRNDHFTEKHARALQKRLLLNVRPTDAQRINAANALHMLVTHKHDHKIPLELTTVITGFMALMGPDGVDSLDNLTATAGPLQSVPPSS